MAIDGPAGSGKSTVAQLAARRTGLQFISSGAMYRAVALVARRREMPVSDHAGLVALAQSLDFTFTTDANGVVHTLVHGEDVTEALRDPEVGEIASAIAKLPELRASLVAKQQAYGREGGIVMEGRDIQTVVFPDADIKVFLTASEKERARRRWNELITRGETIDFSDVLAEVCARDRADSQRAASPLRAASDAIYINTDGLTVTQVTDALVRLIDTWCEHPHSRGPARDRATREREG